MRELDEVVKEVCRVFSSLRIRYVVVGGVTVNLFGRARSTFDVDAIAEISHSNAERLSRAFEKRGFNVSQQDIEDALRERGHFSVFDTRSSYRVDCKGTYTVNERRAISDRKRLRVAGSNIYVNTPETLIVMKLLYGSEQDVLDAESVYVRQRRQLDVRTITARAKALGVEEEWRELRKRMDRILAKEE